MSLTAIRLNESYGGTLARMLCGIRSCVTLVHKLRRGNSGLKSLFGHCCVGVCVVLRPVLLWSLCCCGVCGGVEVSFLCADIG